MICPANDEACPPMGEPMTKKKHQTKLLDELEDGPWPSFVTGLKRLADDDDTAHGDMMKDLLGHHIDDYRGGRESLNVSTHIHF